MKDKDIARFSLERKVLEIVLVIVHTTRTITTKRRKVDGTKAPDKKSGP